jgi:glucose repression regulatory protein TUP1
LAELDLERLPPHQKKVSDDWFAIFNPSVPRVLDVDLLHTLQHESVVCCVRFSHDGKYVATGCNRSAQIFDVHTGQKVCVLQDDSVEAVGDLYIRSVCFSPDGKYLATGAEDKLIRVWDIASNKIRNTFSGHEQDIYSLDFAKDGRTIASGSGDRTVRLWDIETGTHIMSLSIEDGVTTVAISPDTRYVAAGSLDKSVRVWDIATGYLVERLEGPDGHKDSVYSVAFAPNGRDLVSGSLDKTIKMWELMAPRGGHPNPGPKGGRCLKTFEGHKVSFPFPSPPPTSC